MHLLPSKLKVGTCACKWNCGSTALHYSNSIMHGEWTINCALSEREIYRELLSRQLFITLENVLLWNRVLWGVFWVTLYSIVAPWSKLHYGKGSWFECPITKLVFIFFHVFIYSFTHACNVLLRQNLALYIKR